MLQIHSPRARKCLTRGIYAMDLVSFSEQLKDLCIFFRQHRDSKTICLFVSSQIMYDEITVYRRLDQGVRLRRHGDAIRARASPF